MSYIFGEGTGQTYEDIQRKRKIADSLLASNMRSTPRNVGEGLSAIGRALMYRALDKKASEGMDRLNSEADALWSGVFGGGTGGYGGTDMPPAAPPAASTAFPVGSTEAPVRNTQTVGGVEYDMGQSAPWAGKEDIQAGIFAGESGGDYDALFGYQNREGGVFAGMKPSEMRVADLVEFTDPNGAYGQYVKGQVGRVATPIGAYQVVGTTLRDAIKAGVVDPSETFTPEVQDRVGRWVLDTQGTGAWEGYRGPGGAPSGAPSNGMNPTVQALMGLASNPVIMNNPARAKVVETLLGQALQRPDPMRDIELETARLKLEQMRNPQPTKRETQKDQNGILRFVDTGEPVFPNVEAKGGDMTESERRIFMFNSMQKTTGPAINIIEDEGFNPANITDKLSGNVLGANFFRSTEGQMYDAAAGSWSESALRLATGAAATPEEYSRIRNMYFAAVGDAPETIEFKRAMRAAYENVLAATLNGGELPPNPLLFATQQFYENRQPPPGGGNEIPRETDTGATRTMTPEEAMKIADEVLQQQQSQQPSRRDGRR